jgi:hypothetical protein
VDDVGLLAICKQCPIEYLTLSCTLNVTEAFADGLAEHKIAGVFSLKTLEIGVASASGQELVGPANPANAAPSLDANLALRTKLVALALSHTASTEDDSSFQNGGGYDQSRARAARRRIKCARYRFGT